MTNLTPAEVVAKYKLVVCATFIPFSKSRHANEKRPMLNWLVTVLADGNPVVAGIEYSAGEGHCPAYKLSVREAGNSNSIMRDAMLREECEKGHAFASPSKRINPDTFDVLHSLVSDADAIEYRSFDDWAESFGYDVDSRKAEATYRACLAIGLATRSALGEAALAELREAFSNY